MFYMKQIIAIQLILSISLFNILSNNKIGKIVIYKCLGNDQQLTQQGKDREKPQMEFETNFQEPTDEIEKAYIEIPEQHIQIKYFSGSQETEECKLKVVIISPIEVEFTLSDEYPKNTIIKKGKFENGPNNIFIPYSEEFLRRNKHEYRLGFNYNGYVHEPKIILSLEYDGWPRDKFNFEPETGKITLKLKSEGQRVIRDKSKLVLDKKAIIKAGVPKIILGAIILLASPQISRLAEKAKAQSVRTSIESSKRVFNTFGVGLTVYGLSSIFKAFKRNKLKGEFLETNDEAMAYNKKLKEEYLINEREWKDEITVTVTVNGVNEMLNKEVR